MMYTNGFIVTICNDKNETLRESRDREVFLQFNSHYSIRLKNKHSRKAVAQILVDGTDILGGNKVIVPPNSTVSIDRFCLDGNLGKGNKLQFVSENDSRVQDPGNNQNGNIDVKFWLEKKNQITFVNDENWQPVYPWGKAVWPHDTIYGGRGSTFKKYVEDSYTSCYLDSGATVEGDKSFQKFDKEYVGILEDSYEKISIKLRPYKTDISVNNTKKVFCERCGKSCSLTANYCSKCGEKLNKNWEI